MFKVYLYILFILTIGVTPLFSQGLWTTKATYPGGLESEGKV